jgi:hypothetical protein
MKALTKAKPSEARSPTSFPGVCKFIPTSRAPVAHACNPSYSGDRDQEDPGSKPALGEQFPRPYLEKPITKIGLM